MTIKLGACFEVDVTETMAGICIAPAGTDGGFPAMAWCDTSEEAEQARRAFENVLAPRFTRDEAIAIVWKHIASPAGVIQDGAFAVGVRAALEALAAAGVFSDWPCRHETGEMECVGPCACGTTADQARRRVRAMKSLYFEPLPGRMPLSYPPGTVFRTRERPHVFDTYFMAVNNVYLENAVCYQGAFVSWTDDGHARERVPCPHPNSSIGRGMITGLHVPEYVRRFVKEAP